MCQTNNLDRLTEGACDWLARLTCVVLGCAVAMSLFENAEMIRSLHSITAV